MRHLFLILMCLLFLAQGLLAQGGGLSGEDIERIARSVVQIAAVGRGQILSTGSGTVVTPDGLIYTNRHVVDAGDDFLILILSDIDDLPEPAYFARLVAVYDEIDFAVLQIDRNLDQRRIDADSLALAFINPAGGALQRGDRVFIFGYPGIGDGYLVFTEGSIAAIQNGTLAGERHPVLYQTTAEIAPGNSGGLAVNATGQMIGIPTEVRSEDRTGGRLGGILPIAAVQIAIAHQPMGVADDSGPPTLLDPSLTPRAGVVQLRMGFLPDPNVTPLASGGPVDVAYLGGECRGFASAAPGLIVEWTGRSRALYVLFEAERLNADATLIVLSPEGEWYCNDDAHLRTLNPMVVLRTPGPGNYAIWVGSYSPADSLPGQLIISELELRPR